MPPMSRAHNTPLIPTQHLPPRLTHPYLYAACMLLQVDAPPVSDGDFLTAWHMLVLPVVAEFRPDLILVSAGFDAVDKDPLGELLVPCRSAAPCGPCVLHAGTT